MPFERIESRCTFFNGRLFESLPKPSNSALTSTPSAALSARSLKSSEAIESLRKLKYSRCTLLRACRMALNMSSNFSCPLISSVTELLSEKLTPSSRSLSTISESDVCAPAAQQTIESNNAKTNLPIPYYILLRHYGLTPGRKSQASAMQPVSRHAYRTLTLTDKGHIYMILCLKKSCKGIHFVRLPQRINTFYLNPAKKLSNLFQFSH